MLADLDAKRRVHFVASSPATTVCGEGGGHRASVVRIEDHQRTFASCAHAQRLVSNLDGSHLLLSK